MEYDIIDLDGRGLLEYESCIRQVLEADCIALGENGGLAAYIHSPALRDKIKSIKVDIAVYKGRLCGCAEIDYTAEPSEREWNNLLDYLLQQAQALTGKDPKDLNKEERLAYLSYLDKKGALQITKSGGRICEILGISKFTLYNDLEIIRAQNAKGKN